MCVDILLFSHSTQGIRLFRHGRNSFVECGQKHVRSLASCRHNWNSCQKEEASDV